MPSLQPALEPPLRELQSPTSTGNWRADCGPVVLFVPPLVVAAAHSPLSCDRRQPSGLRTPQLVRRHRLAGEPRQLPNCSQHHCHDSVAAFAPLTLSTVGHVVHRRVPCDSPRNPSHQSHRGRNPFRHSQAPALPSNLPPPSPRSASWDATCVGPTRPPVAHPGEARRACSPQRTRRGVGSPGCEAPLHGKQGRTISYRLTVGAARE